MLNKNLIQQKKFKMLRFLAGIIYFIGGLSIIIGVALPFLMEEEFNIAYTLGGFFTGIFLIFLAEIANILLKIEENTRR